MANEHIPTRRAYRVMFADAAGGLQGAANEYTDCNAVRGKDADVYEARG